jgi:hypothetical protein
MATEVPEVPKRQGCRKPSISCLAVLLICMGGCLYMFVSGEIIPGRAFNRTHGRLQPGLPVRAALGILEEFVKSHGSGIVEVYQITPEGRRAVLLPVEGHEPERPDLEAVASRIDRSQPIQVWMSTFYTSGRFSIVLDSDGVVREVSEISGHVK